MSNNESIKWIINSTIINFTKNNQRSMRRFGNRIDFRSGKFE